ncbi:hypothetical protein Q7Z20_01375 [Glaesserella parasuis]|nr:hypothetical protein [Glaesserella parasuis]
MNKILLSLITMLSLSACTNNTPPAVSSSEVLSRLEFIEKLDEREYQKATNEMKKVIKPTDSDVLML